MAKKKDDWMGFYNGKIPKRKTATKKALVKAEDNEKVHTCYFCTNKSTEGDGSFLYVPSKGDYVWVCSPCIEAKGLAEKAWDTLPEDDEEPDDGFEHLSQAEIMRMAKKKKDKNFWMIILGVLAILFMLSLVERSRILSVLAVIAFATVFLLYKYEVNL